MFNDQDNGAIAVDFSANRDSFQYKEDNDEGYKEMLSFLIDSLLLHRDALPRFSGSGGPLAAWSVAGQTSLEQYPS